VETLAAKRTFDVVGHYGRSDLFSLAVRGVAIPLQLDGPAQAALGDRVWRVAANGATPEATVSANPAPGPLGVDE
jgi:hypothetical protein